MYSLDFYNNHTKTAGTRRYPTLDRKLNLVENYFRTFSLVFVKLMPFFCNSCCPAAKYSFLLVQLCCQSPEMAAHGAPSLFKCLHPWLKFPSSLKLLLLIIQYSKESLRFRTNMINNSILHILTCIYAHIYAYYTYLYTHIHTDTHIYTPHSTFNFFFNFPSSQLGCKISHKTS